MDYQETTEYLFAKTANYELQGKSGYKPGLGNMLALDEHLGHPHRHYRTIHVAGTNGKGSVSHTLAAMLQTCGYKVGLYTSPHLVDFSERIRINGKPIEQEYVVSFVAQHKDFIEQLQPSFFEVATAMAFKYFYDQEIDIAVIEVGLGGRLDSTNIITPELSIITNISLDHTQMLGSTLSEIAREKAGIMKQGVTTIIGEAREETRPVFDEVALKTGAHLIYAEDAPRITSAEPLKDRPGMRYTTRQGITFDGELGGSFQAKNANTILCAIEALGLDSSQASLESAFGHIVSLTGLQGRWQTLRTRPTVVCDIGHNMGAWQYLSRLLHQVECHRMHIVFGMLEDKDVASVMALLPKHAIYYFTKGTSHRAMPEALLRETGRQIGLQGKCYPTVREAYNAALQQAENDDFIFVGGSNYVVADLMKTNI